MKLNWLGKISFFILSYYLLLILIIFENLELAKIRINFHYFTLSINWLILIILSIIVVLVTLYTFFWQNLPKRVFEITEIENMSAETLNYLVTIMLGLFYFNESILSFKVFILLLLLYLVYQAGGIYYLQPMLMLFGYKVLKCKIESGNSIMLISKENKIKKGKKLVLELFEEIYMVRGDPHE